MKKANKNPMSELYDEALEIDRQGIALCEKLMQNDFSVLNHLVNLVDRRNENTLKAFRLATSKKAGQ